MEARLLPADMFGTGVRACSSSCRSASMRARADGMHPASAPCSRWNARSSAARVRASSSSVCRGHADPRPSDWPTSWYPPWYLIAWCRSNRPAAHRHLQGVVI